MGHGDEQMLNESPQGWETEAWTGSQAPGRL